MVTNPSFDQGMSISKNYRQPVNIDKWKLLELKYNNHVLCNTSSIPKIPKIIHQIWLGGELPSSLIEYTESVKIANPGFLYKLWTDKDVKNFDFKNKNIFYKTPNLGQRSDILRYAILEQVGGIYLDTDFICYKSFDSLLHLDLFAGLSFDSEPIMFNGLIGSTPHNKIIEETNNVNNLNYSDGISVIHSTGPYFFTNAFFKQTHAVDNTVGLPVTYFYPYPNFNHDRNYGSDYIKYIKPETICLHLWHSRWN